MCLTVRRVPRKPALLVLALVVSVAACRKSEQSASTTFATPEDASRALIGAAQSGNRTELLAIFGADAKELISSGDPVQDKNIVNAFVARYEMMHRWRKGHDGEQILIVGADNFAFPIPLKKNDHGQWFFDTPAGKDEVLNRRVGRDELATINVCRAVANAEAEYFSQAHDGTPTRQYAQKFISDPGKQNGLYWEESKGQPRSPLGPLVALATSEGYAARPDAHAPFHGYYFHMLKGQSNTAKGGAKDYVVDGKMVRGFAFVAYPAEYGNSGIMTFMIDQDGVLLQKDLGKTTAETASAMSTFSPDASWTLVTTADRDVG